MICDTVSNVNLGPALLDPKIKALESVIHQTAKCFKDLVEDLSKLNLESEKNKMELKQQKEKCERQMCMSSESLKKMLDTKEHIINYVVSALIKFNESKNCDIINDTLKVLCGESAAMTPPKVSQDYISNKTKLFPSPKNKEMSDYKQESIYEIEGTPTGCKSPVLHSRKSLCTVTGINSPNNKATAEKKVMKLKYPMAKKSEPSKKVKQTRLSWVSVKPTTTVDLTCSPGFGDDPKLITSSPNTNSDVMLENDTIQPSPTSGPTNFSNLLSDASRSNRKSRRLATKLKCRVDSPFSPNKQNKIENIKEEVVSNFLTDEITRLSSPMKVSRLKCLNEDDTYCSPSFAAQTNKTMENNKSMSLLHRVNMPDVKHVPQIPSFSPIKKPLMENININNIDCQERSMSLLAANENVQSLIAKNKTGKKEPVSPVYKEPTVRKKADKRQLPGWSCDECKNFYGELYNHDPDMLAKKMSECSKHRGKNNPIRPKTPPGFWNPRWDVPEDTEEFNRKNNAV